MIEKKRQTDRGKKEANSNNKTRKNCKYYVYLTGILLADYSKSFTINVNGKAFVTCSVNDYCNKVLNSKNSSNKLSDLVTAIYELGTASK